MSRQSRKVNPFREWLSDNLRYILLFLGIFVILAGLFFGVRAVSGRLNGEQKAAYASGSESETVSSETAAPAASSAASAVSAAESAAAQSGASSGAAVTETPSSAHGDLTVSSEQDITRLISDYYTAMSVQDLSQIQKITDVLPEEQATKISSSETKFSDVKVYTKNGPDADSRIVYAYYKYRNSNQPATLPGLSQMLVRKGADGEWKIVYSELDDTTSAYIESVTADEDVQELITQVKQEYTDALAAAESTSVETASESTDAAEPVQAPQQESGDDAETEEDTGDTGEEEAEEEGSEEDYEESGEGSEEGTDEEGDGGLAEDEWVGVINSSCNVREGAGYDFSVIGGVGAGSEVVVIGTEMDNGWWHIRTDDIEGYIGGRFID